jgi:RHS repeat-associated protein
VGCQCIFTYTWQGSSFQIATRTTTFPVIATTQNGSGSANSRTEQFDAYRQLIWVLDELGYITGNSYDLATGGLTQVIQDASSGTPWTPLPGSHLNLTTNLTVDGYGRPTQSLGPVHSIDVSGTSTSIRRAQWTVYDDVNLQVRVGVGYQKTSDSSFTLINPVRISQLDEAGRVTDEISATRASTSGQLLPTDTFAQSSYVRWQRTLYSQSPGVGLTQIYFLIPSSGSGSQGVNYNQSQVGYDTMRRVIREVTASGTITRYVFNTMGWTLQRWVGTNDNGATETDPSGGGAPGNNMVQVVAYQYDGNSAGGDGNLTQETQYENASSTRVTTYGYDFRNRRTSTTGEINFYEEYVYDNLDRLIQTNRKDTSSTGALVGQTQTNFDDLGRVYQRLFYSVSGGVAGNALIEKTWYSARSEVIKSVPMGTQYFQKSQYDAVGRVIKSYVCYNTAELDTDYTSAGSAANNTVLRQVETAYDNASNVIQTTTRDRFHNATGLGDLTSPTGAQPQARVSYLAHYPDAIGRGQAVANYGTNGAASFTRSATIPARMDTVLITSTAYNSRGEPYQTTDPFGTVTQQAFDDANRRIQLLENYVSGGTNPDQNRETDFTYTADDQLATLTAKNSVTGDQVTTWTYGTTLSDSDVASNDLLRYKQYPDGSSTDRMEYRYNGLGEVKEVGDQNGTVRTLEYDKLGRPQNDRVTTVGTGVDTAVLRITRSYEVRGLLQNLTSYDNATVGSGNVVNDVQYAYNGFMLLTNEYQSHNGAVNTVSSPQVQYGYASGSSNTARRTSMTNPDGTQLSYQYDVVGSAGDVLNRVAHLQSGNAMGVDYSYLGVGTPVICGYSCEPSVELTYYTSGGSGDAGDQYTGLDRFGRIVDQRWRKTSDNTDRERLKYGYDRASNRQWRQNTVAGTGQDEHYTYDGLYQLKTLQRGTLTGSPPIIGGTPSWEEDWNYDPLGNWHGTSSAYLTNVTGSTTLNQNRTHSVANEITGISTTTGTSWPTPVHNLVGNMTNIPQPLSLGSTFDLTWDAWNRPVQVMSSGSFVARYAYDGANRRISKLTGTQFRHYYYTDQWQIIEERTGNNANADRRFFWGVRGIDDLICRDRATLERLYALSDGLNITAVVDVNGFVQERYGFDGFGGVRYMDPSFGSRSSSSYDWETLFGGYRYDQETGLYQVRYRYLHSKLGRWLSRDPIGEKGGLNLYEFVHNNPISLFDPDGRRVQICCREVNDSPTANCLAKICGKRHCFLKTDTKTAGMGPANPPKGGGLPSCPCGTDTAITDQSKETGASCYDIPDADETCVNNELVIGKSLGKWGPNNNCNTFAGQVVKKCGGQNVCLQWTQVCGPDFGCMNICTQWAY